jgi:hypothetical protein
MNAKPKLSNQARLTLAAVKILLKYYQGGYKKESLFDCPLCDAETLGCDQCPWKLFEGGYCLDEIDRLVQKRLRPSPQWRAASIRRLTRWARLIKDGTYDKRLKRAKL